MKRIDPKNFEKNIITFFILLVISITIAACNGNGNDSGETEATGEDEQIVVESGDVELQEQQEEDIVLDPEALSESDTVFDPSITDGETLFVTYCAKCHGLGGLGDGPSVGSLRDPSGMNLTILQDRTDDEIFNTITGGKGVEMPPWGLVLTEEQRHSLVSYVRSLGG